MTTDCTTTAPTLPAVGTDVIITDADLPGLVRGHGFLTPEGQNARPDMTAPARPMILVQIDRRITVEGVDPADLYVSVIAVHPDNITIPLTDAELALLERGSGDRPPTIGESIARHPAGLYVVPR
jgi:hypothetical protein